MTIERWELLPSTRPERFILKVRGDRSDVDAVVQAFPRICQEPREMTDSVYQWAVYVLGATMTERLALQDRVREMTVRKTEDVFPLGEVDLSGVLAELNMVLEGLTGLTEEEQARVAKKMQEIQEREAAPPAAPVPAPVPASVPAPEVPKTEPAPGKPEAPAPAGPTAPPPSPPPSPQSSEDSRRPIGPTAPPPSADVPPEQILHAAVFHSPEDEKIKNVFIDTLSGVAQQKAKRPIYVQTVVSQPSTISPTQSAEWLRAAQSVGADCVFVILTLDLTVDFMESVVSTARKAGLNCFLVPHGEVYSRLFYVDLMVEIMLMKRKK